MAEKPPSFQHLPLVQRFAGKAIIRGGGSPSPQTVANRTNSAAHSTSLVRSVAAKTTSWTLHIEDRKRQKLPVIEEGVPLLLRVDPGFDIDVLRDKFAFEIVSEQEDGFVLVASKDLQLTPFLNMVKAFATATRGSATIASVHQLFEDPSQADRLRSILSESLFAQWPILNDDQTYIFDFGIECTGTAQIPDRPRRGKRDSDSQWAHKELNWSRERSEAYDAWDTIKEVRESEIIKFVSFYNGSVLSIIDGADYNAAHLPDSFTVRVQMTGKGMRDLILSYPFTFEVVEPDDIDQPLAAQIPFESVDADFSFTPPSPDAPAICIIDSGIQEEHRLIDEDFDIRIDVTLSYAAQPRRTRRNLRRYLSTWVEWKSSKLGESLSSFRGRALKDQESEEDTAAGTPLPWSLHEQADWGEVRGVKRNAGTVQKDWAIVTSNQLPESFCIAVVGHQGWSNDPDSSARYSLAVSFEVVGREISIYDEIKVAIDALQVEIENEQEVEIDVPNELD